MRLAVIGLGKLGAPIAACLASRGFEVIGVDTDPRKVEAIHRREAPVYEPGLAELLTLQGKGLQATTDLQAAITQSDATFVVIPTPSEPDGSFSLRFVLQACKGIGMALRQKSKWHLVTVTSTISPRSMDTVIQPFLESISGKRCGENFGLCYSPEFVALGTVIRDLLRPDFVLIGESDARAGEVLASIYKQVCENDPPIARMNFVNAELTKLAVNTYVTMKISFANMLARICERLPGADVDVVTQALGLDSRIGGRYLKGAIGYGGPCFPRDNLALAALARQPSSTAVLAEATDTFNRKQVQWLAELVHNHLPENGKAGILGLAYKPNSDVVEESQGLLLAQTLACEGVSVIVYDPVAMDNARKAQQAQPLASIVFASSAQECIQQADVVVLTTPWDEFRGLTTTQLARCSPPRVVIDCWRLLGEINGCDGITYLPLGIGNFASCNSQSTIHNSKSK